MYRRTSTASHYLLVPYDSCTCSIGYQLVLNVQNFEYLHEFLNALWRLRSDLGEQAVRK